MELCGRRQGRPHDMVKPGSADGAPDAERMGFCLDDFSTALKNLNPIEAIRDVPCDSRIVAGEFDRFIPRERSLSLLNRSRGHLPDKHLLQLPIGHLG